jgi:hypothetical protein
VRARGRADPVAAAVDTGTMVNLGVRRSWLLRQPNYPLNCEETFPAGCNSCQLRQRPGVSADTAGDSNQGYTRHLAAEPIPPRLWATLRSSQRMGETLRTPAVAAVLRRFPGADPWPASQFLCNPQTPDGEGGATFDSPPRADARVDAHPSGRHDHRTAARMPLSVPPAPPTPPTKPRLLDQVRLACRLRHLSPRTTEA